VKAANKLKKVIVLGSTGSIGTSTLDVIRKNNHDFSIAALSCHANTALLAAQANEFGPAAVCITDAAAPVPEALRKYRLYRGMEGLLHMIRETAADIAVHGIAGTSGLLPSLEAIKSGKDLALANKETVVMAGGLLFDLAKKHNHVVLPVDSEHSAVFHLLRAHPPENVSEIILTASGGALRDLPVEELAEVDVNTVLRHPNWEMGAKITVDSATMANKALEVMEAQHFFAVPVKKIRVVIHPQSLVHSLVKTIDGSLYAQISKPDMRLPIQNALTFPRLYPAEYGRLDLEHCTMSFTAVDKQKYPMLSLGYRAAKAGGPYPIVFNAANEIAAHAFLQSQIRFTEIAAITEKILALNWENLVNSVEEILQVNNLARSETTALIERRKKEC
jgi:1-deoxy-D-xylulose-5-phosphate reductoisomerase